MSSLLLLPWLCFFCGPVTSVLYASGFTRSKPAPAMHLCRIVSFKGLLPDTGVFEGEGTLFKGSPCQGLRKAWTLDGKSSLWEKSFLSPALLLMKHNPRAQKSGPVWKEHAAGWTSSRNAVPPHSATGQVQRACYAEALLLLVKVRGLKISDFTGNHWRGMWGRCCKTPLSIEGSSFSSKLAPCFLGHQQNDSSILLLYHFLSLHASSCLFFFPPLKMHNEHEISN